MTNGSEYPPRENPAPPSPPLPPPPEKKRTKLILAKLTSSLATAAKFAPEFSRRDLRFARGRNGVKGLGTASGDLTSSYFTVQ